MTTQPRTPADAAWQGLRDSCPDGPLQDGWNAAFDAIEATWDIVAPPRTPTPLDAAWKELIAEALRRNVVVAVGKHRAVIEAEARASLLAERDALADDYPWYAAPDPAPLDECEWCTPRHEWPCPTIPRCDEPGCEQEATCGWPSDTGYRRTCGPHMREYAKEPQPDGWTVKEVEE
jgi:hypothetical protein